MSNLFVILLISLAVSGCSLAPVYQRPQMAVPEQWSMSTPAGYIPGHNGRAFWEELGSDELNRMVKVALAQNLDLEAALHRIDQARAQARTAGASLYPVVQAGGATSRTYQDVGDASRARGLGSVSYELDLWGRNRDQSAAASYRAEARRHDYEALQLILSADTAILYTHILALDERLRISTNNVQNAEEILRIIEGRYRAGTVSGLEVSQQRVVVNNLRATLATLSEQRVTALHALAIVLGEAPQNVPALQTHLSALRLPEVNLTPPADLLTVRPDIASTEVNLQAANADIGSARAAFFPSFTLGTDASIAATLGHPAVTALALASNVLAPIFSGGRLTGNLENVTARQRELAAQYQKTVLVAFREVEDALAAIRTTTEQAVLSRESVKEAHNAYAIAKARFDAGAIDYLSLLEAQRSLYQAEDSQILVNAGQLEAFVLLRKALGS